MKKIVSAMLLFFSFFLCQAKARRKKDDKKRYYIMAGITTGAVIVGILLCQKRSSPDERDRKINKEKSMSRSSSKISTGLPDVPENEIVIHHSLPEDRKSLDAISVTEEEEENSSNIIANDERRENMPYYEEIKEMLENEKSALRALQNFIADDEDNEAYLDKVSTTYGFYSFDELFELHKKYLKELTIIKLLNEKFLTQGKLDEEEIDCARKLYNKIDGACFSSFHAHLETLDEYKRRTGSLKDATPDTYEQMEERFLNGTTEDLPEFYEKVGQRLMNGEPVNDEAVNGFLEYIHGDEDSERLRDIIDAGGINPEEWGDALYYSDGNDSWRFIY